MPPNDQTSQVEFDVQPASWPEGISGHRVLRRLGGGGMGEVFVANQLFSAASDNLRTVALKTIRPELLTSPQHRLIMENDNRIAARLDRPDHRGGDRPGPEPV